MKLIGALYDASSFAKISPFVEEVVVYSSDFSSFFMKGLSTEEILKIVKNTNKEIIINLEFMFENEEESRLTSFIEQFIPFDNVSFLVSDLGVFQILKEKGKASKAIYNPNTLITNEFDLNFYHSVGAKAAALSLEITVADQAKILAKKEGQAFMEVFGYHLMFHSKRPLVSLYQEFLGKEVKIDNYHSYLVEQTRNDKYHIYESKRGTSLFRPYVVSYFTNLDELKALDYAFVSNLFIDEADYLTILEVFHSYLNGATMKEDGLNKLNSLHLKYEDGFKYQDTIYQKEKVCTR